MSLPPPRSPRTDTLLPSPTLFRSACASGTRLSRHRAADGGHRRAAKGQYRGGSGAMSERILNWWAGLSQRERWLVGVAALLTLGALFWALGRPTYAAFASLEADHRTAIEREGRVAAKAQLLARRPAKTVAAATDAAPIDQFLAQSAGANGLTDRKGGV